MSSRLASSTNRFLDQPGLHEVYECNGKCMKDIREALWNFLVTSPLKTMRYLKLMGKIDT